MAKERIIDHSVFVEGGLLNNVDVEILESSFQTFDYGGKATLKQTALKLVLKSMSGDGEPAEQYLSVGGQDHFYPSKDNKNLLAMGDRVHINSNSNYALFMASMEKCGLRKEDYSGENDISNLEGVVFHIQRVPDTRNIQRDDSSEVVDDKKDKRPKEIVVCTNIVSTPWAKGKKRTATKSKAKAKAVEVEEEEVEEVEDEGNDDINAVAAAMAIKAVTAEGGSMDLDDLASNAFRVGTKYEKSQRKAATKLLSDIEFVKTIEGLEVDEDEGTISLEE